MLKYLLLVALLAGPDHTQDSLDQVKASVTAGKSVLVDVREQDEWDAGHLKAARLVKLSALKQDPAAASKPLPKAQPVYLHCRSGKRSVTAAKILKDQGFDARALEAGYEKLVEAGFEKAP